MTIPVVAHSMTPVYIAQSRGFFADEKLDLDITSTGGGGPDIRALIAGDVEFSFTTGDNVILAHQEGKRLLMVMSGLNKVFINWAMHRESAKAKGVTESMPLAEKIKLLKGLTVGVTNPGALTAHLAAFVIRKAGYNPQQDVQIIPIGAGPTWLAALENRKVDVALTAPPVPETAISRGFAIMFINNAKGEDPSIPEFLMENLVARPETVAKDPDLVRRMVRALTRANQWALKSTPEQVAEALKPALGKTPPDLLLAGAAAVLPALSPDGRTSERNFQSHPGHLRAGGNTQEALALRRACHQRVPEQMIGRGRLFLYRLIFGLVLLAFWELSSGRLIDPFWVSSPSKVFVYLYEVFADGSIFGHLGITLYETFAGFFIGSIFGISLGFALGRREVLAQILDPYVVAFNGIPRIALAPLFIIWFGIGPTSKVILVVSVVFFLTFFNTYAGVKGVDAELKNILRIMGATERQILMKVTLPAIVPWITTGLKISLPYAIVAAVVGEFIAASKGLGYLINYNTSLFSTTGALGGILILALVVVICNEAINRAESYLLRWRPREERKSEGELY